MQLPARFRRSIRYKGSKTVSGRIWVVDHSCRGVGEFASFTFHRVNPASAGDPQVGP